jgi:hypothetical protein
VVPPLRTSVSLERHNVPSGSARRPGRNASEHSRSDGSVCGRIVNGPHRTRVPKRAALNLARGDPDHRLGDTAEIRTFWRITTGDSYRELDERRARSSRQVELGARRGEPCAHLSSRCPEKQHRAWRCRGPRVEESTRIKAPGGSQGGCPETCMTLGGESRQRPWGHAVDHVPNARFQSSN